MKTWHTFSHTECEHYINEYNTGFKIVQPKRGEIYKGRGAEYHRLVFVLEGEIEFSYDEFVNRRFKKGDLVFVPQASDTYGATIENARLLVLAFNDRINLLCDNCTLLKYVSLVKPTEYDFRPLPMAPMIWSFASVMEEYIEKGVRCGYLHQIKQKELFVILQYCYSKEEIIKMFYPALGKSTFHSWVLENYRLDMSMTDLAKQCNMVPKSFSRKFILNFSVTFRDWVLEQKVKHIRLRLSMPDTTFNDIIREFNFSNLSHFNRFCKDNYGLTPTALVKSMRVKNGG